MGDDDQCVLIYTTWPDAALAEAAARALVADKLVACANILGSATSIYAWQGEIEQGTERPMLLKTCRGRVDAVKDSVKRLHPYDVPAIAVLPITDGEPEFLAWICEQTANAYD